MRAEASPEATALAPSQRDAVRRCHLARVNRCAERLLVAAFAVLLTDAATPTAPPHCLAGTSWRTTPWR